MPFDLIPLAAVAPPRVEALLDAAFGADRHGRTAYRLRAGGAVIAPLSFAAVTAERLVGTIQCWPVQLDADDGAVLPLVLVGPVAVVPDVQRAGIGRALVTATLGIVDASDWPPLTMIGDPEYYGRFFGFGAAATAKWRLPGPVAPRRLLVRGRIPTVGGTLGPRVLEDAA